MYRHQLEFLDTWFNDGNRKPLVIRGARQIGKSTLVQMFAKEHGKDLLNVNLERYPELSAGHPPVVSHRTTGSDYGALLQQCVALQLPIWHADELPRLLNSEQGA